MKKGRVRTLVVSQYFWPETFPINGVVQNLAGRGFDIDVLTAQPNYPQGRIFSGYGMFANNAQRIGNATIYRVPIIPRGRASRIELFFNYCSFVISAMTVGPLRLRGRRYDVVLIYLPSPVLAAIPAILIARLKKASTVLWVQDLWPDSLEAVGRIRNRHILLQLRHVVSWIYRRSDHILVSSEGFLEPVREVLGGGSGVEVTYLPNSFSPPEATSDAVVPIFSENEKFRFLFSGNIGRAQCVGVVLEAAKLLQEQGNTSIEFILVGDGSAMKELRATAAQFGLENVRFLGRYPQEAMNEIFAQAHALLLTLCCAEVFAYTVPSKLQAYLAAGKPILVSANGEAARLVEQAQAGFATDGENAIKLVEAAKTMANCSASQLRRMGANGRAYYMQHFEPNQQACQLEERLVKSASAGS